MRTIERMLPTATGFALKNALAALQRGNLAAGPLLQRAGISERNLDNPQRRLSVAAQAEFLERAARALNDTAFGLHLAEAANPRQVGLLFYVGSAAENLGEAQALFARYLR
ncbi:MAG TPA: AraC family transcriptional regulator ligand-binding domain-containing protein, partial [Roseiarcus sp.]